VPRPKRCCAARLRAPARRSCPCPWRDGPCVSEQRSVCACWDSRPEPSTEHTTPARISWLRRAKIEERQAKGEGRRSSRLER
jgi:hypothetical protein